MQIVFRKFPDGQVIALFCHSAKYCNTGMVMSYMHQGQHGEAARDIGQRLPLANEREYASLKRELEGIYKGSIEAVNRLNA